MNAREGRDGGAPSEDPAAPAEGPAGTARDVAVSVVRRVLRGAFLAPSLRRSRDVARLDGRDRSFVTDLAYGTLRHLPRLDAALAQRLRAPERLPDDARAALRLGAYELLVRGTPRHAAVDAWVDVVKRRNPHLAGLANAVLRRVEDPADGARESALSLPGWLLAQFEAALGTEAAHRAAEAMLLPGPLWLRAYAEDAADALRAEGCEVEPGPLPGTLRVRAPVPLGALEAYRLGKVQPQNPTSTLPAALLAPAAGERVLDLASGNGIKTAQLAAAGARVTAVDIDAGKARAMNDNLARLGLSAEHRTADLTLRADLPASPAVLLDAPCTGTGTLRGHPEIKLRLTPDDVTAAAARQRAMLSTAGALLEPGGRLVYAVCSLTRAEGDDQIAAMLDADPALRSSGLGERVGVPHVAVGHGVYVLPLDGLDGFYLAEIRRG
ncbi:MAG TPA: RsmB/NOP family class I SAM-dependent RNA methyltransferase [Trueperaceae bacterium]|nr:RsmB/NOP family class I SAM-dependent RNA methyltransferase [Trueperaceae bacterium]